VVFGANRPTTDQLHNMEPDMTLYAGLDVSLALTSICIVDAEGVVVRETKVSSEPEAICSALKDYADRLRRVGLEAGPLSQHLYSAMAEAGLPAICVEVRHMARLLRAQTGNKTDRNDARGIAQMMRVGMFKVVHVKTERSQRLKVLLTVRKVLKSKLLDIEADLRGVLKNFGLKLGKVTVRDFEARVRELAAFDQFVAAAVDPALVARRALREQYDRLHSMLPDDHARRRPGRCAELSRSDRHPEPVREVEDSWRAPWAHADAISVRRGRLDRKDIQIR
jgi:transposase